MPNQQQRSDYEIDERAAEAVTLLQHPLLGEAMGSIQDDYINVLKQSSAGSPEALTAQVGLQLIQKLRDFLNSTINDKKINDKHRASSKPREK